MKTKALSILLFITLSFGVMSCFGSVSPDRQDKVDKASSALEQAHMDLGNAMKVQGETMIKAQSGLITSEQFNAMKTENEKAVSKAVKSVVDATKALGDAKASGASWWSLGLAAASGTMGRTAIHGLRIAIMAYFPGTIGTMIAGLLTLTLGGSGSGKKDP
jgi:cellobiose-specific phosphotransferase system component IIA